MQAKREAGGAGMDKRVNRSAGKKLQKAKYAVNRQGEALRNFFQN